MTLLNVHAAVLCIQCHVSALLPAAGLLDTGRTLQGGNVCSFLPAERVLCLPSAETMSAYLLGAKAGVLCCLCIQWCRALQKPCCLWYWGGPDMPWPL